MKQTNALADKLMWYPFGSNDLYLAAHFDDGKIDESQLEYSLSEAELMQATKRKVADERRHFVMRRWVQKSFVSILSKWQGELRDLRMVQELDTQPQCLDAPELHLSFSSSGKMLLLAASKTFPIGVDIERVRPIADALLLAQRFFSPEEAAYLATIPASAQSDCFLSMWTAKEAGLKAIGQGIVFGMNTFTVAPSEGEMPFVLNKTPDLASSWELKYADFLEGYRAALVQRTCGEPLQPA